MCHIVTSYGMRGSVKRQNRPAMDISRCNDHHNYEILAEIGEGAYGKVYKGREVNGQQRLVAVKRLNIPRGTENGIPAFMIREVSLLRKIEYFNHPNIVKLLGVSAGLKNQSLDLTLVFEYIDQDLSTFLAMVPATGLSLGKIKVVTLWYRAPEVLLHSSYMSSVDMWSAGCIFAELFLLKPLFRGDTEAQLLHRIFEVIGLPSEEDWPRESPISYSPSWASGGPCNTLLSNLGQEENNLLLLYVLDYRNVLSSAPPIASRPPKPWRTPSSLASEGPLLAMKRRSSIL
ncbi:cyclin-dependent kinase 6 isoform X4 [Esox lucius]|uniref:cyclin-dependent kinase 6 isoform X4 n=1 Tax=Esox lucius TaxID=8010 RepID=UPI0014775AAF|nr:cyclin-dependent kinase 6 isoform X4 [Esox lucius]